MNPWIILFVVVVAALAWSLIRRKPGDAEAGVHRGPEPEDTVPLEREQPQDGGPVPTKPK